METAKTRRTEKRTGDIECDETLFTQLRGLRKKLADERAVPAYVIFGDNTLRLMAREYPTTPDALRRISGVGEKKLAEFGDLFAHAITQYLETNSKVRFE
jgi:ATP-dependent DNA helicase RecQ